MHFTPVALQTNIAFMTFFTTFGFQVSGVGKSLPKPDTRHPKQTVCMTALAKNSRHNS